MDSYQDPTKLQLSFQVGEDEEVVSSCPRSYLDSCQNPTKLQLSFHVGEDMDGGCVLLIQELPGLMLGSNQALP
jgi:hypothetical protein